MNAQFSMCSQSDHRAAFATTTSKQPSVCFTPMKTIRHFLRLAPSSIPAAVAAGVLFFSLMPASTVSAQEAGFDQTTAKARRIEGVWDSQVAIVNPATGATLKTFRGLTMFIQGGSLTATNNQPGLPTTTGPQFGHWTYLGHRKYTASFRFFRFNTDGTFAGSQRVTRTLTLDAGNQSFTGTLTLEILDASDTVIQGGQGTETSVRVP